MRVHQVFASSQIANLSRKALEHQNQLLGHAPARGRRALCCSDVPFGEGGLSGLGFGVPFFVGRQE